MRESWPKIKWHVFMANCAHIQGGPIKTVHFFEIPYFCSHYRYNHALFAGVEKLQQKTTSDNFF